MPDSPDGPAAEIIATAVRGSFEGSIPPSRALLREEVYTQIRTAIIQGLLAPGVRLRDKEIAQSLSVSRTPVREAIRRLQDEGLVVAEASRWTRVAPVDEAAADELYPIIGALERLAVRLSGPWSHEKVGELTAINQRLAQALGEGNDVLASQADADFHGYLIHQSRNQRLEALVRELKVHLHRIEVIYFGGTAAGKRSVDEHQSVIDALAAGVPERAAHAVEENWRASLARLHRRGATSEGCFRTETEGGRRIPQSSS
jgi:DNA-binding GntR family transcriptional regulator